MINLVLFIALTNKKSMNIHKLRECTSIAEADTILSKARAGPAVRKLVETGILLKNNPDRAQRDYGSSFINSAIQELDAKLDKDEEPTPHHDYGVKPNKGDTKFVKEELLAGGDKNGNEGSEQSSDNTEPYPQEGTETPDGGEPMKGATDTENQMKEGFPGMPPMGNGMPGMMPGLEPSVANEMGQGMPQLPPMSTPQMMKQMQYTLEKYHRNIVAPLRKTIAQQKEAIQVLSRQVRESEAKSGSMKLDIDSVKRNAMATSHIQETVIPGNLQGPTIVGNGNPKRNNLESARSDIANLDKQLRGQSTPYQ